MTELQERFASALHNTARAWRQALDRRLRHLGLSQAGWMTIAVAAKSAQPPSQSVLAERLGVEGATMVAMIDRLVRAGLVTREPSSSDRRVKLVRLTPQGVRLYETVHATAAGFRRELLGQLAREDLDSATRLLERLENLIDATQ